MARKLFTAGSWENKTVFNYEDGKAEIVTQDGQRCVVEIRHLLQFSTELVRNGVAVVELDTLQ